MYRSEIVCDRCKEATEDTPNRVIPDSWKSIQNRHLCPDCGSAYEAMADAYTKKLEDFWTKS